MDQKVIEFNKSQRERKMPDIKPGDIVRVHRRIKEGGKERVQVFKGLVIAVKGKQSSSPTITVRRESGGVGVEMVFPIYLPTIEKIDLLRHSEVRRAKLYYMRKRSGRAAKMKTSDLSDEEKKVMEEIGAELKSKEEEKTEDKKGDKKEEEKKPTKEKSTSNKKEEEKLKETKDKK